MPVWVTLVCHCACPQLTQAEGAGHAGQQQEQAPHLEEELDTKAARSLRAFVYDTNNKC